MTDTVVYLDYTEDHAKPHVHALVCTHRSCLLTLNSNNSTYRFLHECSLSLHARERKRNCQGGGGIFCHAALTLGAAQVLLGAIGGCKCCLEGGAVCDCGELGYQPVGTHSVTLQFGGQILCENTLIG